MTAAKRRDGKEEGSCRPAAEAALAAEPEGIGPIRIDRYSPYFNDHIRYGIDTLHPLPAYAHIYPEHTNLTDLAYAFIGDYTTEFLADTDLIDRFREAVLTWKSLWNKDQVPPQLHRMPLGNGMTLVQDTRRCAKQAYHVLSESCSKLLETLDEPIRCNKFDAALESDLQILLDHHYVIEYEGYYLSLVLDPTCTQQSTPTSADTADTADTIETKPELPVFNLASEVVIA